MLVSLNAALPALALPKKPESLHSTSKPKHPTRTSNRRPFHQRVFSWIIARESCRIRGRIARHTARYPNCRVKGRRKKASHGPTNAVYLADGSDCRVRLRPLAPELRRGNSQRIQGSRICRTRNTKRTTGRSMWFPSAMRSSKCSHRKRLYRQASQRNF
ncbi:hypothetical protein VTK56DRAFT_9171 [Thermocarpiscus australiensis]